MIDTIAITLKDKEFRILNSEKFLPISTNTNFAKFALNRSAKSDHYQPKITFYKRGPRNELKVEFSAPKLLHGNNFDELDDSDFDLLVGKLSSLLREMGVEVYPYWIRKADVSKVDYSKNIILSDFWKSSMIINELQKIDMTKRLDIQHRDYRNSGHTVYYHCNSYELVFYDKIKDLQQSKISPKRALDKTGSIQLSLLDEIEKSKKPVEVLRFEIRLGKRIKIKSLFNKLEIKNDLTFQSIFNKSVSKSVLNYYWNEIYSNISLAQIKDSDNLSVVQKILETKKMKPIKALGIVMALRIIQEDGAEELKKLFKRHTSSNTFGSLKKDILSLNLPKNIKVQGLQQVNQQIDEFRSVKMAEYLV